VRDEPRRLLGHVRELELVELNASDACCGFGGTFSLKYPDISAAMGDQKIENLQRSGARYVVANDTGCLMHLRGLLHRRAIPIHAVHLAEVLSHGAAPRV
jgi:L-lactate dehydrogenase complex protein LldE